MTGQNHRKSQTGQSMVEYVVVLMALSAALLTVNYTTRDGKTVADGYIGMSESDQGSLVQAFNQKHRGFGYALSLSEIPETDDLVALSVYYDRLGKYPELSKQLKSGGQALNKLSSGLNSISSGINSVGNYLPPKIPPAGFPPKFPPKGFPF